MNVATAVSFYVDKIVADPKISGLRSFFIFLRDRYFGSRFRIPKHSLHVFSVFAYMWRESCILGCPCAVV